MDEEKKSRIVRHVPGFVVESSRIRLSERDWQAFSARLDEAPRELLELKVLLTHPSRFRDT